MDFEPTQLDFQINPLLLEAGDEAFDPFREIIAAKLAPAKPRHARAPRGNGETIFVVDDDPDVLGLIREVLASEGFDVKSFSDPASALQEFETTAHRPQMIVTDYCMDDMNGLDLLSQIRRSSPDIKSIVISGVVDEKDITSQLHMKRDRFIQKPFRVSNLIETLNQSMAEAHN